MIAKGLFSIFVLLGGFFGQTGLAQPDTRDVMYLIQIDVQKPADIAQVYTNQFDKKRVKIDFAFEDTINYLSDFIYEEERMYGPECFVPEMKLVFRSYTYVVSMYCSKVLKYQNAAPFRTSSKRMKNDLYITQSVYNYLDKLKTQHFGKKDPNRQLIEMVNTSDPLEELSEKDADWDILMDDDEEDDDSDLETDDDMPVLPDEPDPDPDEINRLDQNSNH